MTDALEEAAKVALRLNQVALLLNILAMLEEAKDLADARKRVENLLQTLLE